MLALRSESITSISRRALLSGTMASALRLASAQKLVPVPSEPLALRDDGSVLDIFTNGSLFGVYNYNTSQAGTYRPYFHPLLGPNDRPITQNGEFPGSLRGHHWHRGVFVAHQKVNGTSFWEERAADCGKMVHLAFDTLDSGAEARFRERLAWRDLGGRDLLRETRTVRVQVPALRRRFLDLGIQLQALDRDVVFQRSQYNLLACRVINAMCLAPQKQRYAKLYGPLVDFKPTDQFGLISNSEGQRNEACGGAKAKWCDFSGPLGDGTTGGIAILDHPSNLRFPTAWHNWNNMTIIACLTYYEPVTLKPGEMLDLSYRVYVHHGNVTQAEVSGVWAQFSKTEPLTKKG